MKALATLLASAAIALSAPAAAQSFVVTNATVAAGDGSEPIESGYVVVENGKVAAIGSGTPASNLPAIDANGAWVTPGIFATVTSLGLWDVGAVSESNDTRAGGAPFSAALDVAPVINPSSQHILVHRASGITRAATVTLPSSSIFGGQGAVIDLGADPDAVTQARAFQVVALGEYGGRIAGGSRVATHTLLRAALREASANRTATSADIRSDDVLLTRFDAAALAPVARGEQPLYVYVERASDIRSTLALKREFPKLDLVLVGASEGWLVANEIAAAGVPVIADGLDEGQGRAQRRCDGEPAQPQPVRGQSRCAYPRTRCGRAKLGAGICCHHIGAGEHQRHGRQGRRPRAGRNGRSGDLGRRPARGGFDASKGVYRRYRAAARQPPESPA